jgi:hypothetical protein
MSGVNSRQLTVFGNVNAACTLSLQYSFDNATFYTSSESITITGTTGSNFGTTFSTSAKFARLICSNFVGSGGVIVAFGCAS